MKGTAFALALLIVAVVAFASGWASRLVVTGMNADTILQSLTIAVTAGLAIWTYRATKKSEAQARLFAQKAAVYEPLVEAMKAAHLGGRNGRPVVTEEELGAILADIQFKAIIWGDQAFLRALIEFSEGKPGEEPEITFGRVANLYAQMRRELGHADKPGAGYDIVELLLVEKDRPQIRALKQAFLRRMGRET